LKQFNPLHSLKSHLEFNNHIISMAIKSSVLASLALFGSALAQSVDGSQYNNPTAGPPASFFAAATTVPVAALQSAAAKASTAAKDATYPINGDGGAPKSTIHSDWTNFSEVNLYRSYYLRVYLNRQSNLPL
jgi:hypothetical protein